MVKDCVDSSREPVQFGGAMKSETETQSQPNPEVPEWLPDLHRSVVVACWGGRLTGSFMDELMSFATEAAVKSWMKNPEGSRSYHWQAVRLACMDHMRRGGLGFGSLKKGYAGTKRAIEGLDGWETMSVGEIESKIGPQHDARTLQNDPAVSRRRIQLVRDLMLANLPHTEMEVEAVGVEPEVGEVGFEEMTETLTEKERAVLTMIYVDGKTLRDVGAEMGFSFQRAKQILDKALGKLRRVPWIGKELYRR